jgi:hypothetical protein
MLKFQESVESEEARVGVKSVAKRACWFQDKARSATSRACWNAPGKLNA